MQDDKSQAPNAPKPNVSPQQQGQYDAVMLAARGQIFGDPTKPDETPFKMVLQKLAAGKTEIANTIGDTAAKVMTSVNGAFQEKGRAIPGDVLLHAGQELVQDLVQVAAAAKLIPEGAAPQVVKQAIFAGLKTFGEAQIKTKSPQAAPAAPAALPSALTPPPTANVPGAPPPGIVNQVMGSPPQGG